MNKVDCEKEKPNLPISLPIPRLVYKSKMTQDYLFSPNKNCKRGMVKLKYLNSSNGSNC